MSYLADTGPEEPTPIPGLKDEWVRFRSTATYADELQLRKRFAGVSPDELTQDQRVDRGAELELAKVVFMVHSWSLKDRGGNPLSVTPEALMGVLSRHVSEWIREQATARWEGRDPADERPFASRSQRDSKVTTSTTRK